MNKRRIAAAGATLAAVIAGGALTGAALPALAATDQVEAAAVSEQPGSTIERAARPAIGDDSTSVEVRADGS
ncbi:hypothetical protein [Naasia sp. SYSU D00948]|uniref:hypothetical protein n=1 Tax=Naasia sp. SYSU D00948 TaxID=2817379 RepID=UPI001B300895|nr:hypothetical protein [Naasia sp. SYSU D00948]